MRFWKIQIYNITIYRMSKEEKILELFKKELEDLLNKYRMNDIT